VTRSEQIAGRSLCAAVYRTATLALVVLAVLGALGAVFLSPLALSRVPAAQGIDWSTLGDVGQTYGAASALLSVFALGGVAVSLHLQRRESKAAREQALRGLHTDLLRMALEDATFLECWGPIGESTDVGWYRQHIYLNLVVSHWQMMWEIGAITERHLRLTAGDLFGGPLGRRYWSEARDARRVAEKGRRARGFYEIIDSAYQTALQNPASDDVPEVAAIDLHAAAEPHRDRVDAAAAGAGPDTARSRFTPYGALARRGDPVARPGLATAILVASAAIAGVAVGRLFGRSAPRRSRLR
jgi:hypothetical protein